MRIPKDFDPWSSRYFQPDPGAGPPVTMMYDQIVHVLKQPRDLLSHLDKYYGYIIHNCLKKMSRWLSDQDIEDVRQSALLRMWQDCNRPDFTLTKPLGWYLRHAFCRAVELLRRRKREARLLAFVSTEWLDGIAASDAAVMDPLERAEFGQLLEELVADLPEGQAEAVRVFIAHQEELPAWAKFEALADLLSAETGRPVNPATVRSQLRHACGPLRDGLRRGGYDPNMTDN
jgi:DNA-directed RNA polymerase specialized sigma24 family protein